jgi:hypothetical protein
MPVPLCDGSHPERVSFRRARGARWIQPIKLASGSWIIPNSIDRALRDQVDAPLGIRAALDVVLRRRQT